MPKQPRYYPKPGDVVNFKYIVGGRLYPAVGIIKKVNSDRTFVIRTMGKRTFDNIKRDHILGQVDGPQRKLDYRKGKHDGRKK